MLRVLEDNGWAGKVKFVGFDASDTLVKGWSDGHIDALVLQDPVHMGYLGVKTMVAHIRGQPVERRIDTGVAARDAREHERSRRHEGAAAPDLGRWLNARTPRRGLSMSGVRGSQGVRRDGRARRRGPRGACRRGLRAGRPERRRQEHADGQSVRALKRAGRGLDVARRRACAAGTRSRRGRRRGDDLPGAVAGAAPQRDGEHPARRRARALHGLIGPHPEMAADALNEFGHHGHPPDARWRAARPPASSSSRSRARSPSGAACSCSTSRRAASATPTSGCCST